MRPRHMQASNCEALRGHRSTSWLQIAAAADETNTAHEVQLQV